MVQVYELYTKQRAWPQQTIFRAPLTAVGFAQAMGARHALSYLLGEAQKGGPAGLGLAEGDTPLIPGPQFAEYDGNLTEAIGEGVVNSTDPPPSGPFQLRVNWDRLPGGYTVVYFGDARVDWNSEMLIGALAVCNNIMLKFQALGRTGGGYSVEVKVDAV